MSQNIGFNRVYIEFGDKVRDFERTPDILYVIDDFMDRWGYSIAQLINAKFSAQWLGKGEATDKREDELDLIFEIVGTPFFEIVGRDGYGYPYYAGYLSGSNPVLTHEIINGYRVIETTLENGATQRHEYTAGGYAPIGALGLRSKFHGATRQAA